MTPQELENYTDGMDCRCYGSDRLVEVECKTGGEMDGLCRLICEGEKGRYSLAAGHPARCKCRLGVIRDPSTEVFMTDENGMAWGFTGCRDPNEVRALERKAAGSSALVWIAAAGLVTALFFVSRSPSP